MSCAANFFIAGNPVGPHLSNKCVPEQSVCTHLHTLIGIYSVGHEVESEQNLISGLILKSAWTCSAATRDGRAEILDHVVDYSLTLQIPWYIASYL